MQFIKKLDEPSNQSNVLNSIRKYGFLPTVKRQSKIFKIYQMRV